MIKTESKDEKIDLGMTKQQKERGEKMAEILGLSLYEYIRRCADAHTAILETDSFRLVK